MHVLIVAGIVGMKIQLGVSLSKTILPISYLRGRLRAGFPSFFSDSCRCSLSPEALDFRD